MKHLLTKWLRDSGLKVNEEKTELCLFHQYDHHPIFISLNGKIIQSQNKKIVEPVFCNEGRNHTFHWKCNEKVLHLNLLYCAVGI